MLTNSLLSILAILVSIAFFTMLERKILSYIQLRKGPNKAALSGLLQPFSDALKLFNKHMFFPSSSNFLLFSISPPITFILSLLLWPILPFFSFNILDMPLNTLVFLLISSLSVYSLLLVGWSANSKYSQLGAIRSIAQMISYEVCFFLLILSLILLFHSYNMLSFSSLQYNMWFLVGFLPIFFMWLTSCLAEVNRTPFDFAESESELVSGFNVEFMGSLFAIIFLSEYSNILLLSSISTILFTGNMMSLPSLMFLISMTIMFLWTRGTLPRFRYDILMKLNWMMFLPITLSLIIPIITFSLFHF